MDRPTEITYEFVESAPDELVPETMYISIRYRAVVHRCLCGCGEKVLLNLDPSAWSLTFDGRSISIHDSVGNVGIPCRSHYVIEQNRVIWLPPLTRVNPQAALGRERPARRSVDAAQSDGRTRWWHRIGSSRH